MELCEGRLIDDQSLVLETDTAFPFIGNETDAMRISPRIPNSLDLCLHLGVAPFTPRTGYQYAPGFLLQSKETS